LKILANRNAGIPHACNEKLLAELGVARGVDALNYQRRLFGQHS
jgi:hypothetical protein